LLKVGLGRSSAIIALNFVLLLIGLFAAYRLLISRFFNDPTTALNVCSLCLLSWILIKHFTMPLTEIVFFGSALSCLAVMNYASTLPWGTRFGALLIVSWLLMIASMEVRRTGIALIPTFIFIVFFRGDLKCSLRDFPPRAKWIMSIVLAAVGVVTLSVISNTARVTEFRNTAPGNSIFSIFFNSMGIRLRELGELTANLPSSKWPGPTPALAPVLGLIPFSLLIVGLLMRRKRFGSVEIFLVSYLGILCVWPFYDARFWLPVLPFMIGYAVLAIRRASDRKWVRTGTAVYCSVFSILGIAALAYSTRITFAGSRFADLYGDGSLRPSYCAISRSCSEPVQADKVDPKVTHLIQIYN
jgi:hypothetical protein